MILSSTITSKREYDAGYERMGQLLSHQDTPMTLCFSPSVNEGVGGGGGWGMVPDIYVLFAFGNTIESCVVLLLQSSHVLVMLWAISTLSNMWSVWKSREGVGSIRCWRVYFCVDLGTGQFTFRPYPYPSPDA